MNRREFLGTLTAGATLASTDAVFNVCDYGAKGEGVAADSAAVQRTLDAATMSASRWRSEKI